MIIKVAKKYKKILIGYILYTIIIFSVLIAAPYSMPFIAKWIFAMMPFYVIGLVCVIFILKALIKKQKDLAVFSLLLIVVTFFVYSFGVELHIQRKSYLDKINIEKAKTFCEKTIPLIETYKSQHGKYPSDIKKINLKIKDFPRFVNHDFYESNDTGTSYSLKFIKPSDLLFDRVFRYDSNEKYWYSSDF